VVFAATNGRVHAVVRKAFSYALLKGSSAVPECQAIDAYLMKNAAKASAVFPANRPMF
jgi:hypothetical protein